MIVLAGLLAAGVARGQGEGPEPTAEPTSSKWPRLWSSEWPKEKKLEVLNAAVIGGMATYGLLFWGYGGHSFQVVDERWLSRGSVHGGADKFGHAFSTYVGAMSYGALYEKWGYERHLASRYGALSSFATFFMIEFGDAFSRHGFSVEDLIVDACGALWGYLRREHPAFRELVDFRVAYWPSWGTWRGYTSDYISDYSGFKYLLAFKGAGVDALASTWMKYLELQLGYYTRGYESQDWCYYGMPHRVVYAGIGVNLSAIFRERGWRKTATFLDFYQPPLTSLTADWNIDR
ncbi:MAG: YfiM family protein [Verrucomicrobia bacterium]|nr:YfiM family protein [Verrucomicrobiota bacterium]